MLYVGLKYTKQDNMLQCIYKNSLLMENNRRLFKLKFPWVKIIRVKFTIMHAGSFVHIVVSSWSNIQTIK